MDTTNLKTRMNTKVQALSEREPGTSQYLALTSNALELIQENLKHQPLSFQLFDMVKSPSGGSTVFSVPGLSGEEAEKELTGIILDYTTPRAYWATSDPVEGMPPTCLSKDSLISQDGKACAHCPFNDFGSKDGESPAKACKESVLLFLLRPGSVFPLLVRVPVTSKKIFLKSFPAARSAKNLSYLHIRCKIIAKSPDLYPHRMSFFHIVITCYR